jgi:hypothetical protein
VEEGVASSLNTCASCAMKHRIACEEIWHKRTLYIWQFLILLTLLIILFAFKTLNLCYSYQEPDLKSECAACLLLGLRVWIPPGTWMSVSCECCVSVGRVLCNRLITRPQDSYWMRCAWMTVIAKTLKLGFIGLLKFVGLWKTNHIKVCRCLKIFNLRKYFTDT